MKGVKWPQRQKGGSRAVGGKRVEVCGAGDGGGMGRKK